MANKIRYLKPQNISEPVSVPIRNYLQSLLFCEQRVTPTPMQSRKLHYGTIRFQNTLTVNASGNSFVGGSMEMLGRFASSSTTSPILYCNNTTYDPNSNTNAGLTGWNPNIVNQNGNNFTLNEFDRITITTGKISLSYSGVSNLNKQGTIHIFEDWDPDYSWGSVTETAFATALVNKFDTNALPKCNHYRKFDFINLDNNAKIRYNYMPAAAYITNSVVSQLLQQTSATTGSDTDNKNFGIIIQGAAPGTIIRYEFELHFSADVANDFINKYPLSKTNCFLNPDPYLTMLGNNTNNVIILDKHQHKLTYMVEQLSRVNDYIANLDISHQGQHKFNVRGELQHYDIV